MLTLGLLCLAQVMVRGSIFLSGQTEVKVQGGYNALALEYMPYLCAFSKLG